MQISIEISLYPLGEQDYRALIGDFIAALHLHADIQIMTNGMSTQIFGEYEAVMSAVHIEMKKMYEHHQAILVMKVGRGTLKASD